MSLVRENIFVQRLKQNVKKNKKINTYFDRLATYVYLVFFDLYY